VVQGSYVSLATLAGTPRCAFWPSERGDKLPAKVATGPKLASLGSSGFRESASTTPS
jgi:hypothetical protein